MIPFGISCCSVHKFHFISCNSAVIFLPYYPWSRQCFVESNSGMFCTKEDFIILLIQHFNGVKQQPRMSKNPILQESKKTFIFLVINKCKIITIQIMLY